MLNIEIKVNGQIVDFIHIHNGSNYYPPKNGKTIYGYTKGDTKNLDYCIKHDRDAGWIPLVIKVLKDILKKEKKNGKKPIK